MSARQNLVAQGLPRRFMTASLGPTRHRVGRSNVRTNARPQSPEEEAGEPPGIRTPNLVIKSHLLYR